MFYNVLTNIIMAPVLAACPFSVFHVFFSIERLGSIVMYPLKALSLTLPTDKKSNNERLLYNNYKYYNVLCVSLSRQKGHELELGRPA